ncbi:MAG: hypothetical protein ACLPWF_27725 [Bryobacteraceae bacterium]
MTTQQQLEFKAPSHTAGTAAIAALISPSPLIGIWTNTDKTTNDIVKIVIAASGTGISVDVFGACVPTPCVWGKVPAISYAETVSSIPAVAFSAQYKFSFAQVIVVGHLNGKYLEVETFTEFTDGSGRSNLYTADQLIK